MKVKFKRDQLHDRALVNCEYRYLSSKISISAVTSSWMSHSVAPFSQAERKIRRSTDRCVGVCLRSFAGSTDRCAGVFMTAYTLLSKSVEIGLAIKQTLEASILVHLYPRTQIDIFVQVLQADGGRVVTLYILIRYLTYFIAVVS